MPPSLSSVTPGMSRLRGYAASIRRKPFHMAVAAPEVSTGRMRSFW